MELYQRSPLSDLTNLTKSSSSLKACSSIGSSRPLIHDEVVESQVRRKGKGKALMAEFENSSQVAGKLKGIIRRKPQKASKHARKPVLIPRNAKKKTSPNLVPLLDYFEQQRAYFAEIDAFELVEEEVSESELE